MTSFDLNPAYLAAAATCVSSEETRYYLKGVFVTPHTDPQTGKGVLMVATDGRRLAAIYDREGTAPRSAILSMDWKSKALKPVPRVAGCRLYVDLGAKQAKLVNPDYSDEPFAVDMISEIDGTFPDFRRVLPAQDGGESPEHFCFNTDHLASFSKAAKLAGFDVPLTPTITQHGAGSPALVTFIDAYDAAFVIMPVRAAPRGLPDFLQSGFARVPEQSAAE